MNTKHPYAEVIHAFADGKAIQCRVRCGNPPPWEDITKPSWLDGFEYRVKPAPLTWMEDNKNLLIKVGQLTQANYDLRDELGEKDKEINRLKGIIKCLDNSISILTTESRQYRQTNADLHNEIEHLKKQNEHLQWGHDTAQAVSEKRKQEIDELQHRLNRCMMDKDAISNHYRGSVELLKEKITDLEHKLLHAERAYAGVCLQHAEVSGRLNAYEKEFGNDCVSAQADASADTDAQVFGADVIISIQFPPQEKL